jgi:hypothetical protein
MSNIKTFKNDQVTVVIPVYNEERFLLQYNNKVTILNSKTGTNQKVRPCGKKLFVYVQAL